MSSAAVSFDAPAERLHPGYLLTGLAKSLRGAFGVLAGSAYFLANGQWYVAAVLFGGYLALSIGALLIHWLRFEYRVGADELRIDSGLFSRTSRVIPFDRVTDIDLEQGPIHRLFGLARVRIETGAASAAEKDEGTLDTIALARAEALRDHVRHRRVGAAAVAAAPVDSEAAPPLYRMDPRRVATAGLFNFSLAVIAGLFGLTQTMGDAIGFDPFERQFWIDNLERIEPLRDIVLAHQIVAGMAGTVVLIMVGVVTGLIRTTLREHGFRLDRTATGLRRRGLLTLTDVTVPVKRVQAAILATGPIRRRFGWFTLKLQSLAQDGKQGDHVVAPLATDAEAAAIQQSIGQPLAPRDGSWRPLSRAYVWSFIAMLTPALLATLVAAAFAGPWTLVATAGLSLLIGARILDWRRARFALDDGTLFIETGWWRQRRVILPVRKIQSLDLAASFWSRMFGAVAVRLGVAGGTALPPSIPALPRAEADALRAAVLA